MIGRWNVRKRDGVWQIIDPTEVWVDRADTLTDAFSDAMRHAVCQQVWSEDGISRLRELQEAAGWWQAYMHACEVVSR